MIIKFAEKAEAAALFAEFAADNIRRNELDAAEKEAEFAAKQLAEIAKSMSPAAAQRLDDATMAEVKSLMMYANFIQKAKAHATTASAFWAVEDMLRGFRIRAKALSKKLQ